MILLVARGAPAEIGRHLQDSARHLDVGMTTLEQTRALEGPVLARRLSWRLLGHRPLHLGRFSNEVVEACRTLRPDILLATGIAPIHEDALTEVGRLGVVRVNYLTDDPWNPVNGSAWFRKAIPHYDLIFNTRTANIDQLQSAGCNRVEYLQFAYSKYVHFPEELPDAERDEFVSDVVFVGGADRDRVPYFERLGAEGIDIALYGGYWDRYEGTRRNARGLLDIEMVRRVVGGARVAPCLVRRANRDGSSMRSFEVPAMRGCMITEDTEEHRALFGPEGEATLYFSDIDSFVNKTKWLLANPDQQDGLRTAAHSAITQGRNTYDDRLTDMLDAVSGS